MHKIDLENVTDTVMYNIDLELYMRVLDGIKHAIFHDLGALLTESIEDTISCEIVFLEFSAISEPNA